LCQGNVNHKNRITAMARRDYFYDREAPKPNSIRPAAAVALFDVGGNILLLCRKDNDKWTMPGGTLDFGESLTDCAIRELREETGLRIRITGLIGTYTDPHILIAYSDGEVRQEFTFVYAAEIESGELKIDDESKQAVWVPLSAAVELPLAESQRLRLKDIMEYQKERRTFLR
jgi:8-oxo-dGTP diphosphatase